MTRVYGELDHIDAPRPMWVVRCEPHVMVRLKRIFPRVNQARTGEIMMSDTPDTAADLTWAIDRWPLAMTPECAARLHARTVGYIEGHNQVTNILNGQQPVFDTAHEPTITPRPYQTAAAAMVLATGRLLLTDELGLGKTITSLLVLQDPKALPALVVTLTHLPTQWLAELNRCFPWLRGHIITSGTPYDIARRRGSGGFFPDVLISNYHKLDGWQEHLAGKMRTVIFDEAQELRHDRTFKYIAAKGIADRATYRMGLTATPVYNYGGEIHNILNVIAPDALGDRTEFAREWCTSDGTDGKLSVKHPAALGAHLREEGLMLRRTRVEVGRELPEVQRVPHTIDIDEAVLDEHAAGAEHLARIIIDRAGTNTELWKAAGDLDWRLRHATGIAKAPHVADFVHMLLTTEEPVVLFGWHRDVYDIWLDRLAAHRPAFFTGEETATQKRDAARRFLNGDTDLLIMSLRAGAGLDGLQERSRVVVFGELDWSPGVHDQCVGRLHRDGQNDPVVAYFLVADEGSDPAIADVLNIKQLQARPLIDPEAPLLAEAPQNQDRVRHLAQEYLKRRAAA